MNIPNYTLGAPWDLNFKSSNSEIRTFCSRGSWWPVLAVSLAALILDEIAQKYLIGISSKQAVSVGHSVGDTRRPLFPKLPDDDNRADDQSNRGHK